MRALRLLSALLPLAFLAACSDRPVNDPYPAAEDGRAYVYAAFVTPPRHLDPARSYEETEQEVIGQIYEPPLQYAYLKRPYTLEPLSATAVPQPVCHDRQGRALPDSAPAADVADCTYDIHIRPDMRYQPHPAFARDAAGHFLYRHLTPAQLDSIHSLADFSHTGTREIVAADYVHAIRRLADPRLDSPVLELMAAHIVGLGSLADTLAAALRSHPGQPLDIDRYPLPGATVIDRYTYRITLKDKYPQFAYWLAMTFFAPVPREVDDFYNQPGLASRNISLDTWPLGSGPYMLTVNDPNRRLQLDRNPYFHGEGYPAQGAPGDAAAGLLADAGKALPLNDGVVFSLEKETMPYWNKFLQGYYDRSGVASDTFNQAIRVTDGGARLTPALAERGIRLQTVVEPATMYMGFNMLDPVVGGRSARARQLRQAISLALDEEEFIGIFLNGRGTPAQGPLPPGIFGHTDGPAGINPVIYHWQNGQPQRKPLATARQLLAAAGYPGGRDSATGRPLILSFDTPGSGPEDKARLDWLRKQFGRLGIQLNLRVTDYNRFQDKLDHGDTQMFEYGWDADYPDPENFLFLLYGPNGHAAGQGENLVNYANLAYDRLFTAMRALPDGPRRLAVIRQMLAILRVDSPWVWGYHPVAFALYQPWYHNAKPNPMAHNTLKYIRIDVAARQAARRHWNRPHDGPLLALVFGVGLLLVPVWRMWRRREQETAL